MDSMGEWCVEQHRKSGLTKLVLSSSLTMELAEYIVLEYIKKYVPKHMGIIAG